MLSTPQPGQHALLAPSASTTQPVSVCTTFRSVKSYRLGNNSLYDHSLGLPYQDYREQSELHQTWARTDSSEARQLRRSERAGIRFEHLQPHALGITIMLPKSKTDQEGQEGKSRSRVAAISTICHCPNAPARSWRSSSGCARPASRAGRSSARSTVGETCKKPP